MSCGFLTLVEQFSEDNNKLTSLIYCLGLVLTLRGGYPLLLLFNIHSTQGKWKVGGWSGGRVGLWLGGRVVGWVVGGW